jgi:hypothetical protein
MAKSGSGGRPSVQIKKLQATNATNLKTGSKVPPIVGPLHPTPGSSSVFPPGSPKQPPKLARPTK